MAINNRQVIINLHTLTNTGTPDASLFEVGEIAVQNTASDPALYIHSGTTAVAKIISEAKVQELIENSGVQSIAGETGAFTLRGNGTNDGDVNLTLGANNQIQADFVGLNNITAATVNAVKGTATTYTDLGLVEAKLGDLDTKNGTQDAAISANTDDISALDTRLDSLDAHSVTAATQNGSALTISNNTLAFSADTNVIETVKVNGTALTVTDKAVDVTVPTKVSDLDNDSNFATTGDVDTAKTQLIGDMTGETKTLGALQDAIEALETSAYEGVIAGNGISVTSAETSDTVAIKIANGTFSGLTVDSDGLKFDASGLATAEQGAKADTAIQKVTINGTDYTGTTVNLGTNYVQDSAYTHTDNNYTTEEKTKLAGISTGATKVTDGATNGYINIDGTETEVYAHPTFASAETAAVKVGRDSEGHTTLGDALGLDDMSDVVLATPANGQVLTYNANDAKWENMAIPAQTDYNLTAVTTPDAAYAAQYEFWKGDTKQTTINIPKDQFLKTAKFYKDAAAATADGKTPPSGQAFPALYFEWELTNGVTSPTWVAVNDLVDTYSAGTGVTLDGTTFKGVVDSTNAHGLSVGADGFALALADGTNAGAMSSAHYTKLEGIEDGAEVNIIEGVQLNGADIALDADKKANVVLPSATVSGENAGVNVQVVETTGEIKTVTVTVTPGSVADNETSLVNGDAVYDAIEGAKTTVGAYTVNGKAINTNPTLDGSDVDVSSAYTKASAASAIASGDSLDTALGKLEYKIDSATSDALVEVEAGSGITVSTKADKKQAITAKVDTTADAGVALTLGANGIGVSVTEGSVASGNGDVVNGGQVYTAIEAVKTDGSDTSASTTIAGAKLYADAVAATAVDGLDATATTSTVSGVTVQVTETNGKLDSAATLTITGGAVAENNAALVNGGQVYTAIEAVKADGSDTSASTTIAGAKLYADAVAASAVDGLDASESGASSGITVTVDQLNGKITAVTVDATNANFDVAGAADDAKEEVIGTNADASSADTIYGAKKYAEEQAAAMAISAVGDSYVTATTNGQEITVQATQTTQDVIDNALVGIESGKESGASVNSSNELDFSLFRIDAGTY